ncbi:myosin-VIIa-like [Gigantopelta aegis]|uniref:myosin-VIIa-like n=1 Tax=Gigantopelta aegis TaxID=1735272 RepID=UPI001B88B438|nr:myosin-VIIa-like [Gigantopelta aegis]
MAFVLGQPDAASARKSIAVNETRGPATAFEPDDDDDMYSVSEYSTVGRSSKKGNHNDADHYYKATLSKSTLLERLESITMDNTIPGKEITMKTENGQIKEDTSPEGSNDNTGDLGAFPPEPEDVYAPMPSSFTTFAQTRFQMKIPPTYCCAALQQPLLPKQDKRDHLASLSAWIMVLRIMGDLPEPDMSHILQLPGDHPQVISRVKEAFKKRYTKKEIEEAHKNYSELFKNPMSEMTDLPFISDGRESMLEKVQYVCAMGIYRTDLRDELYCQLCKQLTNNPSRNSMMRGWVLMMLLAGCFTPSEKFAPCFETFLRDGPAEYAQKVDRILRRTGLVGTRSFPPSWLEFQAAKNSKPILIPITFMNNDRLLLEVDAASTVKELCWQICEMVDIKQKQGFSVYICLQQKISCLGHGLHRILDAISECEQRTRELGMKESSALWRLYFRKEYFTPWHDAKLDPAGTDVIYQQIMRGISLGEYKCQNEDMYVLLGAQKYYLEYSDQIDETQLDFLAKNWFPKIWIEEFGSGYFVKKVMDAVKTNFSKKQRSKESIKMDIVTFAIDKWSLLFSRFYDATKFVGAGVGWADIIIGLSGKGMCVLDDGDAIRIQIPFYEMSKVKRTRQSVVLSTFKGEEYTITTHHSEDLNRILCSFLYGLRMRSRYAIVMLDSKQLEAASGLNVVRGDLIILDQPYEVFKHKDLYRGVCKRTGKSCDIPRDLVYIIQTVNEPTIDILGMFVVQFQKDLASFTSADNEPPHTLQAYSRLHFRQATENPVSKLFKSSFKRDKNETTWQFSKESLKKPLLRRTITREDLKSVACRCFTAIQQFMGDASLKEDITEKQLVTDFIIDPTRRNRYLREEVFCQLMKQLTNNPDRSSEMRGWQLMMVLCTTGIPTNELVDELQKFFRTRKDSPAAHECVSRLATCSEQGCRHYSPQDIEFDMLATKQPTIRIQIVIPDGTKQTVEVGALTRIIDIKREVCKRLDLRTSEEFSIVLCVNKKVHALSPKSYYFDCLGHADNFWIPRKHGYSSGTEPALVILKKIWVNSEPGIDSVADSTFHFPQELPNYIRGYHHCSVEDAIKLAALVYRSRCGSDKGGLSQFSEIASSLLPNPLLKTDSMEHWQETVSKCYNDNDSVPLTSDAAKTEFLRILSKQPTYGCVFFEVKQRTRKEYPKNIIVAINMRGLHLIDAKTQKILVTYDFQKIPNWAYDEDSLTLVIVEGSQTNKILLETQLGHNMDDVLMSYIGWLMNDQMRRKQGFSGYPIGESHC